MVPTLPPPQTQANHANPKQPLSNEEKAIRKQQLLEKKAERDALVKAVQAKEMENYFKGLPSLVLTLLSELGEEGISSTLNLPEPGKFKLVYIVRSRHSDHSAYTTLNFSLSQEDYSYSDYVNLMCDFDNAFFEILSVRRSRLEEEENHHKREVARAKLTTEERKLLGI